MTSKILLLSKKSNEYSAIKPQSVSDDIATTRLTSAVAPTNSALFSTQANATTLGAWRAFNQAEDAIGWQSLTPNTTGYIGYDFPVAKKIGKYVVRSGALANITWLPKDWTFEGSDDDTSWTVLDTQTNQSWTTLNTDKEYLIDNPRLFKMYRLNITSNNGHATLVGLNELKMHEEVSAKAIVKVPSNNESDYISHGSSIADLDRMHTDFTEKHYIQDVSTPLGEGKVFEQALDVDKAIKKIRL